MNAQTNNGQLLSGVNYRAPLLPIKMLDPASCGVRGVGNPPDWIHKAGQLADVINISLNLQDRDVCDAIAAEYRRGKLTVSSSDQTDSIGNMPDKCSLTLAVTASDRQGRVAWFALPHEWVKLAAPGDDVTTLRGDTSYDYEYVVRDGTSFAAPTVAGAAQLLLAAGVGVRIVYVTLWHSATPIPGCNRIAPAPNCDGRLMMERAFKSSLKNGVAEFWDGGGRPWPWTPFSGDAGCGDVTQTVIRSSAGLNYSWGGTYSIGIKCTQDLKSTQLYQWQPVSAGYTYRFFTGIIRQSNGPTGSQIKLKVCYYDDPASHPDGRARVISCSQRAAGSTNPGTTNWTPFGMLSSSPAGATHARIAIRVDGPNPGHAFFDDLGFYVYGPNPGTTP